MLNLHAVISKRNTEEAKYLPLTMTFTPSSAKHLKKASVSFNFKQKQKDLSMKANMLLLNK